MTFTIWIFVSLKNKKQFIKELESKTGRILRVKPKGRPKKIN